MRYIFPIFYFFIIIFSCSDGKYDKDEMAKIIDSYISYETNLLKIKTQMHLTTRNLFNLYTDTRIKDSAVFGKLENLSIEAEYIRDELNKIEPQHTLIEELHFILKKQWKIIERLVKESIKMMKSSSGSKANEHFFLIKDLQKMLNEKTEEMTKKSQFLYKKIKEALKDHPELKEKFSSKKFINLLSKLNNLAREYPQISSEIISTIKELEKFQQTN